MRRRRDISGRGNKNKPDRSEGRGGQDRNKVIMKGYFKCGGCAEEETLRETREKGVYESIIWRV